MRRASSRTAMIGRCASCSARTPLDGHFRPLLPLARALRAAGTSVAVATEASWQPSRGRRGVRRARGGPVARGRAGALRPVPRGASSRCPHEERRPHLFTHIFAEGHAPAKLPGAARRGTCLAPDVIVYESGDLAAPDGRRGARAAESRTTRSASMVPFAAVAARRGAHGAAVAVGRRRARRARRCVSRPLRRSQPAQLRVGAAARREHPAPAVPTAQPSAPDLARRARAAARLRHSRHRLQPAASLPSAARWPRRRRSALVTIGRNVDPESLGAVPPNVRIERFVPQAHVLPRCAAVVSHGGSGQRPRCARARPAARARAAGRRPVRQRRALRGCRRRGRRAAGRADGGGRAAGAEARPRRSRRSRRRRARVQAEIEAMPTAEEVAQAVEEHVAGG